MIFAACAAFTLAILVYVFWVPADVEATPEKTRLVYLRERKDAVYENLRDLNFEYKAGKLPDADYHSMKTALEEEAAALLAEIAALEEYPAAAYVVARPRGKQGAQI
jgi:type II secretory pathway component PulM